MKYSEAQLISKYTTLHEDKLYFQGQAVETIPIQAWESWMNDEPISEKKVFFSMMLQRAFKTKKRNVTNPEEKP